MIALDPNFLALVPDAAALSKPTLWRFLNRARTAVGLEGEVEVLLTSDAELKRLNRAFRNKNKATDILSFPAPSEVSQHHAGDLAISLETAARQASQFGHTLPDELRILILHGLLHLSGLDHETDTGEMAAREATLRSTLKLPTSLIARAGTLRRHSDPEQREGEESPNLHLSRRANGLGRAKKKAKGPSIALHAAPQQFAPKPKKRAKSPSHISLGQRPWSASMGDPKRDEGPIHEPRQKPRARP